MSFRGKAFTSYYHLKTTFLAHACSSYATRKCQRQDGTDREDRRLFLHRRYSEDLIIGANSSFYKSNLKRERRVILTKILIRRCVLRDVIISPVGYIRQTREIFDGERERGRKKASRRPHEPCERPKFVFLKRHAMPLQNLKYKRFTALAQSSSNELGISLCPFFYFNAFLSFVGWYLRSVFPFFH